MNEAYEAVLGLGMCCRLRSMWLISWFQVYLCGVHEWPTGMLKRPDGVNVNSAAVAEEDMNGSFFIALKDEVTKNDKVLIRLCSSW